MVVWFGPTQPNVIYSESSNYKNDLLLLTDYYLLQFTEHTGPLFSELKWLKVKDIFSLTKLLFMFDFINENVPEELKTIFSLTQLFTHMKLAPQWYSTYQKLKRHASV